MDDDLAKMTTGELLAVVSVTAATLLRLNREVDATRLRQARAMALLQPSTGEKRARRKELAARAGITESAVRQAIKKVELTEAKPLAPTG
jgi:DNA-binding Xre family transcriptional regulator